MGKKRNKCTNCQQRISAGTSMGSENFYLHTASTGVPATCYYSDAVLKPEIQYEYTWGKHVHLSVHTGLSMVMKSGLYKKNRFHAGNSM